MSSGPAPKERCTRCQRQIEMCTFCCEPGCKAAICYDCLRLAVRQAIPQLHAHGG